ncbi:YraN family protein [Amaricoccus tamworthensis]|uniref:YraN family protein n=1 Tax=Amaricoccus tamworthensis TaxID=57002 RepID=UPI003C7CEAB9
MTGSGRNHQSGLAAEETAALDYKRRGAKILEQRWRCAEGEIDLIVQDGTEIVFVEVKARKTRDTAAGSISARQWARIGRAAMIYLAEHASPDTPCRFDAFLVDGTGQGERLENAASFDEW